jgi:hypothetical protein
VTELLKAAISVMRTVADGSESTIASAGLASIDPTSPVYGALYVFVSEAPGPAALEYLSASEALALGEHIVGLAVLLRSGMSPEDIAQTKEAEAPRDVSGLFEHLGAQASAAADLLARGDRTVLVLVRHENGANAMAATGKVDKDAVRAMLQNALDAVDTPEPTGGAADAN